MSSTIEKIIEGQLWDFHGGVHPPENKSQSNQLSILNYEIPEILILPLKQHIGSIGNILVNIGDHVLKGQQLTHSDAIQCCPIHAPSSGTVVAIEPRPIAHPSGLEDLCIVIAPDFHETWAEHPKYEDYAKHSAETLIEHIRLMGIAGMGGAGFPSARKLQTSHARTEILIINAVECEPYITADDRLMQDYARDIATGVQILQHIIQPKLTIFAIEDNKPYALKSMSDALAGMPNVLMKSVPTKYPSGGEKQLIKLLTDQEVPHQNIPAHIGIMMQNVGTVFAIKRAIINGEPLIQRVVTLTGNTLKEQRNRWTLLGTPIEFLLKKHGHFADRKLNRLIIGGPMMGYTAKNDQVPVTKMTNCILVPTYHEMMPSQGEMPCIRCSACSEVCPVSLLPQQLQWYAKAQEYEKCEEYQLSDCIECGACAYVCPSEIPLVQYYRQAKAEIQTRHAEAQAAERARQRFDAKKARLEYEKKAREEKHKQAAAKRRLAMQNSQEGDAIEAAIARVKAKSEQEAEQNVKPAVAAAIARAKAKQAEKAQVSQSDTTAEPDNSEMIALREERKKLARERKAQKALEQHTTERNDELDTPASETNSAAITVQSEHTLKASETQNNVAKLKKAAVNAAIARAKAKQAAKAEKIDTPPTSEGTNGLTSGKTKEKTSRIKKSTDAANQNEDAVSKPSPKITATDPKAEVITDTENAVADPKTSETNEVKKKTNNPEKSTSSSVVSAPVSADDVQDPKKAAVAAAIARAKAKQSAKTQQANAKEANESESNPLIDAAPEPEIKTKKPRTVKSLTPSEDTLATKVDTDDQNRKTKTSKKEEVLEEKEGKPIAATELKSVPEDPKKAAVAAAIARAKAKQAAQLKNNSEDN